MGTGGYILTCWLYIWNNIVKHSITYRIICGMYHFIHCKWQTCHIASAFRREIYTDKTARRSLWGRICFLPFILTEQIQRQKREYLISKKERSGIVRIFNYYIHNILALNLRFIGIMLLSASSIFIADAILHNNTYRSWLIVSGVSLLLALLNINITELLSTSKTAKVFEKLFDTHFSFNYFYLTKCGGKARLFWAAVFGLLSGVAGTALSPVYSFALMGGLFLFAMILYKTEFGIYTTILLVPHLPTALAAILSVLCFISLIIRALTTKKFMFRTEGVGLMLILMIIIYIISVISPHTLPGNLKVLFLYSALMLFYFTVINIIRTKKQLFDLIKLFILSSFVVCIYPLLQYFMHGNLEPGKIIYNLFGYANISVYSPFTISDSLGIFLLLVTPLSFAITLACKKTFSKLLFLLFSLTFAATLILLFPRSYILGLIVSALIFITFAAGKLWGLTLFMLPFLPSLITNDTIIKFTEFYNTYRTSTSYRSSIWSGTIDMLKDYWISGVGIGSEAFNQVYPFYSHNMVTAQHPHNLFLNIFSESGIFGIGIFLFLILVFIKKTATGYGYCGKGNPLSTIMLAACSAIIGLLVNGMFNNSFYNYRIFMLFWFILAIGIAARYLAKEDSQKSSNT